MKVLETLLFIIAVGLFIYIYFKKFISSTIVMKKATSTEKEVEDIVPANLIGKIKFKLVSHKEALEASREFIYRIAKTVMEKFSPASKETLLEQGARLLRAEVQYIHVVDIFKISLDKQRALSLKKTKEQIRSSQQK